MNRTLGRAFLLQAFEDLRAAKMLGENMRIAPSTFCMLLQMVFEKLAKASFFKMVACVPPHPNHRGATEYFAKYFDAYLRFHKNRGKYYLLMEMIRKLENYQPSIAKNKLYSPQLEYPWVNAAGNICTPAEDLPLVQLILNNNLFVIKMRPLLKLAEEHARELDKLMP